MKPPAAELYLALALGLAHALAVSLSLSLSLFLRLSLCLELQKFSFFISLALSLSLSTPSGLLLKAASLVSSQEPLFGTFRHKANISRKFLKSGYRALLLVGVSGLTLSRTRRVMF